MCLAIPVCVEAILPNQMARITIDGIKIEVSTALIDQVNIGDYLIVHVGYALSKLDPEEAKETLATIQKFTTESSLTLAK